MWDRNFFIGLILMMIVLFAWQYFFAPPPPKPQSAKNAATAEKAETGKQPVESLSSSPSEGLRAEGPVERAEQTAKEPGEPALPKQSAAPADTSAKATKAEGPVPSKAEGPVPSKAEGPAPSKAVGTAPAAIPIVRPGGSRQVPVIEEKKITLSNPYFNAEFSNRGAVLTSFTLNKHKDKAGPSGQPFEMASAYPFQHPLLTTFFADGARTIFADDVMYEVAEQTDVKLVFTHREANYFIVEKTFEVRPDIYSLKVSTKVSNIGASTISGQLSTTISLPIHTRKGGFFSPPVDIYNAAAVINGKLEKSDMEKAPNKNFDGKIDWVGFNGQYFLWAQAPEEKDQVTTGFKIEDPRILVSSLKYFNRNIAPGADKTYAVTCFMGPKETQILEKAEHNFVFGLDYGWFGTIATFLVGVLNYFYRFTHNYGVAILIVTIIIRVALFPLTHSSYKSMKAMQKLQPEIQRLREQFQNDKEKLNREIMDLYRKHKVNPAGGCLPIFIQLPIFIAFYRALYSAIELRHQPFFWWIQDLADKDPYYITPLLMGATMILSQKMSPSSGDPVQNKVMMVMPALFTLMFLSFPSGLVLYWLMSNVLSIGQQYYINRTMGNKQEDSQQPKPRPAGSKKKQ